MKQPQSEARKQWIEAGLRALRTAGPDAIRIDRLAAELGLTKGSFHHHFRGAEDFHRALCSWLDERQLALAAELRKTLSRSNPFDVMRSMSSRVDEALDPELDRNLRAWARSSGIARETLARIDRSRLELLEAAWSRLLDDPKAAKTAALLPHVAMIGATTVEPPLSRAQLVDLIEMLAALAPLVEGLVKKRKRKVKS